MTTQSDLVKLEAAVIAMIEETVAAGKTVCMFNQSKLLQSLHVSSLKIRHISSEISEILAGAYISNTYGTWETGEYESDMRYLVRLAERNQLADVAHYVEHKAVPREARRRACTLEVPKGISADKAQQLLEQACSQFLNSGNVADLHDEDLRRQGDAQ